MITKHIYLGNNRIAVKTGAQVLYYHPDHLGSSNVITDASGSQAQLSEYKPFGELSRNTASLNSYYFTGKELDSTGLYYYGARYYDPRLARFITPDPVNQNIYDPQNLNPYAYCRNNPLNLIDPTGESWTDTWNSWTQPIVSEWNSFASSGWGKGIGRGIYKGVIATSAGILTAAWLSTFPISTPIIVGAGYSFAILGSATLGLSAGAAISGYTITGEKLSDYRRGELLGSSLVGAGMLGVGSILDKSFQPYWKYIGENSKVYDSSGYVLDKTWLTRGAKPPYGYDYVLAKDKLQLPNMPIVVEKVNIPWWKYVAGPRQILSHSEWGSGGDFEWRLGGFEDE